MNFEVIELLVNTLPKDDEIPENCPDTICSCCTDPTDCGSLTKSKFCKSDGCTPPKEKRMQEAEVQAELTALRHLIRIQRSAVQAP
jgi:hypothetical protein